MPKKNEKRLTVEIINPEALPEASKRFTRQMYQSYKQHLVEESLKRDEVKEG
ncbi:hypothetical protein [Alkalibaculum sporogenes]|uniref:hypothetical protein n=1 Tax=Alkalibaculum sporogenes TaxID=2655001 RepID=UPI00187B13F4|nr:hypothetical protein [Alkalibaculum sporogenes]